MSDGGGGGAAGGAGAGGTAGIDPCDAQNALSDSRTGRRFSMNYQRRVGAGASQAVRWEPRIYRCRRWGLPKRDVSACISRHQAFALAPMMVHVTSRDSM